MGGNPATANVRSGTVYGPANELTGTCAVPAAGSVALGVAVDNTTGTAILTAANVQTALTSQGLTTARAGYLDNLSAAPPTASDIALAVNSALDRTGYSLTDAERQAISTAVQQGILNENDGQAILNAIVGAIGNTNVDQVALVAAIRADLERSGGTLATRLAASAYTAPLDAAGTRSAVGLSTANLDTQLSGLSSGISGLPSASAIASAVWASASRTLTTAIDNSSTIAAAVWSYATGRTITGGTVTDLTNAPDVPTPAEISAEVWSTTTREITGGTVDTVTNSSPVDNEAIATAVRSELAPELAHLDADVSSRQQELERLGNVATTQEVGDIVEGALSN